MTSFGPHRPRRHARAACGDRSGPTASSSGPSKRPSRQALSATAGRSTRHRCNAVATMDTVTLIRSAIRSLLKVAGRKLRKELEAVITSSDDYASSSKPQIDWTIPKLREALIDSRAKDAYACLGVLHGKRLDAAVTKAAELLAKVTGQDPHRRRRRHVPHRPQGRKRPGDLDSRPGRPATATRPRRGASMASRATWQSTPTPRSSPQRS